MNAFQAIEQRGALSGEDPMTRTTVCETLGRSSLTADINELLDVTKTVRDCTPGVALILGADPERHAGMIRGLKSASLAGRDEWPKNVIEARNCLSKWEGDEPSNRHGRDCEGSSFVSDQDKERREPKERCKSGPQPHHANMTRRNRLKKGHILAALCPDKNKTKSSEQTADTNVQEGQVDEAAAQQLIDGSQLADENEECHADLLSCEEQKRASASFQLKDGISGGRIPKDWILLDSQSAADAFSNPKLLKDIHEV